LSCVKLPGQDSNLDKESQKTLAPRLKVNQDKDFPPTAGQFAHGFAQTGPNPPLTASAPARPTDPGLARILDAWPTLPAHIKAAVLALVQTGTSGSFMGQPQSRQERAQQTAEGEAL
jgi:hypothetical protein